MDSTLPPLRCCCCGGPHLNGDCDTYSYCDLCGKDLVYCSCEPEWVQIEESYPWLGQPKILEEPDLMVVIDKSYPWLADDWLPDEQSLNQSNQPQLKHDDCKGGSHLNENCEPPDFTSDSKQAEQGLIIEESWEKKKDREEQIIFSTHLLRSRYYGSEELDQYLDSFYALFSISHLERLWKHTQLYLKFMKFLPHKRKKKDDVFFVSYIPP